jgi:hypothetical protein
MGTSPIYPFLTGKFPCGGLLDKTQRFLIYYRIGGIYKEKGEYNRARRKGTKKYW